MTKIVDIRYETRARGGGPHRCEMRFRNIQPATELGWNQRGVSGFGVLDRPSLDQITDGRFQERA
jgi:hypothetical protein